MKKISLLCVCVATLFSLVFQADRAYGSERGTLAFDVWQTVVQDSLLREAREVERMLGVALSGSYDDFLSLETATFGIDENDSRDGPYLGVVYIENGIAVGFSTHYRSTSRGMLTRFKLAHFDELLYDADLSAIAGAARDCAKYHVFTVGGEENVAYLLDGDVYRRMEKLGALPALPPSHGRVGLAA